MGSYEHRHLGVRIDQEPLFLSGSKILSLLEMSAPFSDFLGAWDNLVMDEYQRDRPNPRERRHCKFSYRDNILRLEPHGAYYQSTEHNPLYGGITRHFAPVEPRLVEEPGIFLELIKFNLSILPISYRDVTVNCHFMRIKATVENQGEPTPEGIHSDGFDYISIHLIQKLNCRGGDSAIYNNKENVVLEVTLSSLFDSLYINDRQFKHYTSPIYADSGIGSRDMLLCSYEPYSGG